MKSMKDSKYEVMIPVYWDQLDIITWSVPYIRKFLNPKNIVLIGPAAIKEKIPMDSKMSFIDEDSLVEGMCKKEISVIIDEVIQHKNLMKQANRAGWYLQQFIKMAYSMVTSEKNYLVWDADMVPLRKIEFWDDCIQKKVFISGGLHHHMPYYDTMSKLLDIDITPSRNETYVAHNMFFETSIMKELIEKIQSNSKLKGEVWWKKILYTVNPDVIQESGFSEYETYGEYVNLNYSDKYIMKDSFKKITNSRTFFDNKPSKEQLKWISHDYDAIGFEIRASKEKFWFGLCESCCGKIPFKIIYGAEKWSQKITLNYIKYKLKRLLKLT